ncbi:hypothetical protein BV25DRAFT_1967870 [Artomyces pyxidatus]|uniref:Uncharacterized protein n=1 Tax=Artomyces pyxidatus TaxID=48021 RepID=A0ACB8SP67_9AGAM|nr:hypothetical protein BV25DRAFT_1967870 [Artomyces pyxidatus]
MTEAGTPVEDDDAGEPSTGAPTPAESVPEDDADGNEDSAAGDGDDKDVDVDEQDDEISVPVPRPRGRPRGRGRGALIGSDRAKVKGRGRGTGRGRGRGRGSRGGGITIRLPKRTGDDGQADSEELPVGDEGTPGLEDTGGEVLGGGKPFRMIQGKAYIIDGDEYVTDDDPIGDTKIDKNGNLLGGERRKFKAQTFALPMRHPERMYILAIDAARTSGFRDSLYYFRRNLLALKLNATQPEKEYLIEIGKLGSHLRTRSVTLITARSAYKLHGAKMILDGRWVVDDYFEDKVLAEIKEKGLKPGDPVGDLAEPQTAQAADTLALASAAQKAERGGGQGIYRAGGPTTIFGGSGWGPYSDGPLNAVRKSLLNRDGLNEENWMLIAAQRTVELDEEWAKQRRQALRPYGGLYGDVGREEAVPGEKREAGEEGGQRTRKKVRMEEATVPMGIYEPHSGIVLYRADTQPTKSRWESLPDTAGKRQVLGGTKTGNGAWALAWVDTVMEVQNEDDEAVEAARQREELLAQSAET